MEQKGIPEDILKEWIEKAKPLVDSAWNLAVEECIRKVDGTQVRWAEFDFTPEAILKDIINSLTNLKKK